MSSNGAIENNRLYEPEYYVNWDLETLYDLAEWKNGLAFKNISFSNTGKPVIKIAELKNGITDQTKFTKDIFDDSVHLAKGDLIFSWSGSPQTSIDVFWYDLPDGWLNQHIFKISVKEKVDRVFFFYILKFLKTNFIAIATNKQTTGLGHVTVGDLKNIKVRIPSLIEQNYIAATLSCLDDKIEINNHINKTLEKMAQAMFRSWFVDFEPFQEGEFEDSELGRIPKGWRVGTLDECIDFYNGYAFKSKELLDCEVQESYHVFKMGHIKKWGGFNPEGTKSWIGKNSCKDLAKYVLKVGDLLMCMTDMKGNVALLGHTALMNMNNKYIVNQRVGLLRTNNNFGIDFPYLYILTNSHEFIENLRGRANSGVQVNLSTNEIKASKMIIAPKEVNTKYNEIVMPMFQKMFGIVDENQTLIAIRDALLPKLMSGEIRVPFEEV